MSYTFRVARQMYKYNMGTDSVAAALGMAPSTLNKKLRREGASYAAIRDAVRLRMLNSLIDEGKTLGCIVHELGYNNTDCVRMFLKRSLGMNYKDYRANRVAGFQLQGLGLIGGRV